MFKILFAPLQGYTTATYRKAHLEHAGGVDAYYAPFLRVENGMPRKKDLAELDDAFSNDSALNDAALNAQANDAALNAQANDVALNAPTIPQIIVNSVKEFDILVEALSSKGYREIDINMGCPFPMQVKHHRGAGLLSDPATIREILDTVSKSQIKFSIKMRLGQDSPSESMALVAMLNDAPLKHITLHPRLGKQQYKGALDFAAFKAFQKECTHPLYFNGETKSIADIVDVQKSFPGIAGIMLGRGLLSNPLLATEYKAYAEFAQNSDCNSKALQSYLDAHAQQFAKAQAKALIQMHQDIFDDACKKFQGDSQIMSHIQSFWDYQENRIPKKIFKRIKKSTKIDEYLAAVSEWASAYKG